MKNIIITICFSLICLQANSQLAYEVLDIVYLDEFSAKKHNLNGTPFTNASSETRAVLPKQALDRKNTTKLRSLTTLAPAKYPSIYSLHSFSAFKRNFSDAEKRTPLSLVFHRTNEGNLFKFLLPINHDILNLPSSQQIPKGFGPTFKI
ncbi:hypothetical protein ACFQZJ_15980 [Maribacter chungangensis]|uniref:Uncharacterized protein n=1 Tax=Maribacter chungangensis TaxID=1069117 RepID=A0ABW3B7B9_9FLAO